MKLTTIITLGFFALGGSLFSQDIQLTYSFVGLSDSTGQPIQDGSFGIVVADTSGNGFLGDYTSASSDFNAFDGTSLTFGSALGGSSDDVIVASLTAADYFGYQSFTSSGGFESANYSGGTNLALYWFSDLTTASITGAVSQYGFYRSDTSEAGTGTIAFVVPSPGSYTLAGTLSEVGGNASVADLTAVAVPEPSTYAMMLGALALGFVAYRRRRS